MSSQVRPQIRHSSQLNYAERGGVCVAESAGTDAD